MKNTITSFISELGSSDLESFKNVLDAYLESGSPDIMDEGIGFNSNSGYAYIGLENGISICSCFGQSVQYLVTDFDNGEEYFFESYEQAEEFLSNQ
jgi:hypothetical protein